MLSGKRNSCVYGTQTTYLFAYYIGYTVIRYLIWSRGAKVWWQDFSAITEGSLAMSLCIPRSILPSSHNTLDTPFLIIIFITLFACLNCLSEPHSLACLHGRHSYARVESCPKRGELRKYQLKHDSTPSHIVRSLKVHNPGCRRRRKAMEGSFLVCARNALILPRIGLINSPLIMSKLSRFYLIPTCRLKRRRHTDCVCQCRQRSPNSRSGRKKIPLSWSVCRPPPVLLMVPTLGWMCPLCAGSRGDGDCYGFVFIRFMNRAKAGTVMTALRCRKIPLFYKSSLNVSKDCKRARNGGGKDIFIVAFYSHTKHTMFLEGCLICRIWAPLSNIYPDLFFFIFSLQ